MRYIQIGDRVIDLEVGHVHHHGETTQLPPRLLSLLRFFAEHGDRVLSRDDIIEGVWGHLEAASDDSVNVAVSSLRRAMGDDRRPHRVLKAVPRRGYRFEPAAWKPLDETQAAEWLASGIPPGPARADASASLPRPSRPVLAAVLLVVLAALAWTLRDDFRPQPEGAGQVAQTAEGDPALDEVRSIAVLPLDDLSEGQDQNWFADGLAEEIIQSLSRIPELQLRSRTASFQYRDSALTLGEVAQALRVSHILHGSVRSSSDRIRVTAQLTRTMDGLQVWSANYDRAPEDLISIQEDLARNIAEALQISLDPEAMAAMAAAGTQSVEAYQAYLKGIALDGGASARPREEVLLEVRDYLEQAVAADPQFSNAWYRLADWWLYELLSSSVYLGLSDLSMEEATEEFHAVINQAIEHASNPADRNGYRAMKAEVAGRLREAINRYADLVEARPNQYAGWSGLMNASLKARDASNLGRAFAWLRAQGREDINSAITYIGYAYQVEDPSRVADYGLERLEQWPDQQVLLYQVHRALLWAGRVEEGSALLQRINDDWAGKNLARLRQACSEGRVADAEAIELGDPDSVSYWMALKILGRDQAASEAIAPQANSVLPYQQLVLLGYWVFDPGPFPSILEALEHEGLAPPSPIEIPFRCERPHAV